MDLLGLAELQDDQAVAALTNHIDENTELDWI